MRWLGVLLCILVTLPGVLLAANRAPATTEVAPAVVDTRVRISDRTLVVGIEVDRENARLVSYTVKDRPFLAPAGEPEAARAYDPHEELQLEVKLLGRDGGEHLRRFAAGPLCFDHRPQTEPHIEGDTIRMHRDGFVVELPELEGYDRIEVAYHEHDRDRISRLGLGSDLLDRERFTSAAGELRYDDLKVATPGPAEPPVSQSCI